MELIIVALDIFIDINVGWYDIAELCLISGSILQGMKERIKESDWLRRFPGTDSCISDDGDMKYAQCNVRLIEEIWQ